MATTIYKISYRGFDRRKRGLGSMKKKKRNWSDNTINNDYDDDDDDVGQDVDDNGAVADISI